MGVDRRLASIECLISIWLSFLSRCINAACHAVDSLISIHDLYFSCRHNVRESAAWLKCTRGSDGKGGMGGDQDKFHGHKERYVISSFSSSSSFLFPLSSLLFFFLFLSPLLLLLSPYFTLVLLFSELYVLAGDALWLTLSHCMSFFFLLKKKKITEDKGTDEISSDEKLRQASRSFRQIFYLPATERLVNCKYITRSSSIYFCFIWFS